MDLSRYKNIILHIRGHDIGALKRHLLTARARISQCTRIVQIFRLCRFWFWIVGLFKLQYASTHISDKQIVIHLKCIIRWHTSKDRFTHYAAYIVAVGNHITHECFGFIGFQLLRYDHTQSFDTNALLAPLIAYRCETSKK